MTNRHKEREAGRQVRDYEREREDLLRVMGKAVPQEVQETIKLVAESQAALPQEQLTVQVSHEGAHADT